MTKGWESWDSQPGEGSEGIFKFFICGTTGIEQVPSCKDFFVLSDECSTLSPKLLRSLRGQLIFLRNYKVVNYSELIKISLL